MKSFTNMFADLLNDGRPGRSSSSTSSSSAAAAQQARGGRSTTGSRSASTAWESFDDLEKDAHTCTTFDFVSSDAKEL